MIARPDEFGDSPSERAFQEFLRNPDEMMLVQKVARSMLGPENSSEADVDDLVQETLLRAYRNLHGFRGDAKVSTWVISILKRSFLDYLRKRKRDSAQKEIISDTLLKEIDAGQPSLEETFAGQELYEAFSTALRMMENVQSIILLSLLNGYGNQHISDQLQMTKNEFRGHLYRARLKLRSILQGRGYQDRFKKS